MFSLVMNQNIFLKGVKIAKNIIAIKFLKNIMRLRNICLMMKFGLRGVTYGTKVEVEASIRLAEDSVVLCFVL